ncbi:MAG: hypothetical protein LBK61_07015 [Spirochaetaceae bacterium]|jgi:hypothetical protein|nr:hypothetical protein [Spirochaetaceae bacterium]
MTEIILNNALASLAVMRKRVLGLFVVYGVVAVIMMLVARLIKKTPGNESGIST